MAYDICKICSRFFERDGQPYCHSCRETDLEEYRRLREYVKHNPGVKVFEAANMTGIPIKTIMRFVEERRIHVSNEGNAQERILFRDK